MKIYYKNIIWNYTVRQYLLVRYYIRKDNKSIWKSLLKPYKRPWNSKQEKADVYQQDIFILINHLECEINKMWRCGCNSGNDIN